MGDANGEEGGARVVYLHSSPLVKQKGDRKARMVQLSTNEESKIIRDTLKDSKLAIHFRAMVATPILVARVLNDGCQMIHYVGHGEGGCLSFESDDERQCGIMESFPVNALQNLVQSRHARAQLVFLGSCCSELSGNAFVSVGVPHVVAVKGRVADKVAYLFSQEFYKALFGTQRHTVQVAFDIASSAVCNMLNAGNPEQPGGPFVLLPSDGNHDVPIFDRRPGEFIDKTKPLPEVCPDLPRARDPYLGEHALQKVVAALVDPFAACVTVVGERGSGKTETAIHACKYVQERRKFDAIFFAKCDKPRWEWQTSEDLSSLVKAIFCAGDLPGGVVLILSVVLHCLRAFAAIFFAKWDQPRWEWQTSEDFCPLVGRALGMNPAPSSIEQLSDFLFKQEGGGPHPRSKVLLVLDGVDALVEGRNQKARDALLEFLCSLSERKDSYNLKLLVTSNVRLIHDSSACFRPGSEQVLEIKPLEGTDPAQLFFNAVSRNLTRRELGVALDYSQDDVLVALLRHLEGAKGHPGTLVRLASSVDANNLMSPSFGEAAVRIWEEFHPTSTSPSSSPTFNDRRGVFGGSTGSGSGGNRDCDRRGMGSSWSPTNNGIREPHQGRRESRQRSRSLERLMQESNGYDHPQMCLQQHPHDTASETELRDLECYSIWQEAIGNAQADGRAYEETPLAGGAVCERTDHAPLKCVSDALRRHLCQQQCFSNSHCRIRNDPQYEFDDNGRVELEESESDDAVDTPTPCGISDEEMRFVEKRLQAEQRKLACGGRRRQDGDAQDTISIEGFVQFCKWWAAVMATVWQLRDDRWSTAVGMRWFVGRQAAHNMLSGKEAGTFLLRFSESRPGALVISLKKNVPSTQASSSSIPPPLGLDVVHCLVNVDHGGRCCFVREKQGTYRPGVPVNTTQQLVGPYSSLQGLILSSENMQKLYPNIPKEEALQ